MDTSELILVFYCYRYHVHNLEFFKEKFHCNYRIAGMFGGGKVWRIASSIVVGEKKFGECLVLPTAVLHGLLNGLTSEKVWMV